MKLRAPRCSEAMLLTSSCARQVAQSEPKPGAASLAASVAAAATPLASTQASSSACLMRMEDHPLGHRLHLVDARVPRHQQKIGEIADPKDACQYDVQALGGLQPEIAEHDEGDGKHRKRPARE